MRTHSVVAAAAVFLAASVFAEEPLPVFTAQIASGKAIVGPWRELGPDWSVRIGADAVDGPDVLTVRRTERPLPPLPIGPQLILAGGDSLPLGSDPKDGPLLIGERLHFHCPYLADGKDVSAPLSAVSVIWYAGTAGENPERLRRRLAREMHKQDLVLLRNGDALEGVLNALDEKAVTIEVDRKPVTVEIGRTAAISLSSDLTEAPRPKGVYGRVVLTARSDLAEGARLSLASARCADGATLTGVTLFGAVLSVPLAEVASLDMYQGKAVALSELKPIRYEYFPYLDDHWDYALDGAATGLDLRLGGSTYDKGVGMHSHSRLTYAVPADCRRFEAVVGLDDRAGRQGGVRVGVLADGKPLDLGGDRERTAGGGPLSVHVDVAGVKELTLEVDFGKNGPVQGYADWVDARFVK